MTARTSAMTGGSNSFQTTAEDLNAIATDFISDGIVGAITATSGVAPMTGGLSVNAQGTPDRTVAIGAGIAYVTATPTSQASQRLRVQISAQNLTHATNSTGATRYDWIYVQVSASLAANPALAGDTTGTVVISRSTSSATDNGTPPTYGYHIATVTLTNGYTTIVNGNIADTRVRAGSTASSASPAVFTFNGARLKRTTFQTVPDTTATTVTWDAEDYDTNTYHDNVTNPSRLTIATTGYYTVGCMLSWTSWVANSRCIIQLRKNGSVLHEWYDNTVGSASEPTIPLSTEDIALTAGDYIEVETSQFTGSSKSLDQNTCRFWIKLNGV